MAAKAFAATAAYDAMISQWFAFADQGSMFPAPLAITGSSPRRCAMARIRTSSAALYIPKGPHGHRHCPGRQLQGKELSYNNYNDADAALELAPNSAGRTRRW
jgi:phosphoribosylaminoimidazolecarboxamide formyltransferase/IMP cyclohydrolase